MLSGHWSPFWYIACVGVIGECVDLFASENKGYFKKSVFVVCNIWEKVHQLHIVGHVVD